jgi:hypothetical protein
MTRGEALGSLSAFTSEQWGMVTAAQARSLGVSRVHIARLVGDGVLEPVAGAVRVYRLVGAPPDPDREPVRAAWLQLGDERPGSGRLRAPDAVVAGRSAALVLDLGDLSAPVHDFYVIRRRQVRRQDVRLRVRKAGLPSSQWAVVEGLPVCSVAQLVHDLLAAHEDGSAVARICQDAEAAGKLDLGELDLTVGAHHAVYGRPSPAVFAADLLNRGRVSGVGA